MEGVMTEMPITTTEEKAQRRLEVKARSTLMMGIPNEHQLKFNSIKNDKKLLEAVKRDLASKAYDQFGTVCMKKLSQEDVNQKLLRSLSPEWNTHAVVWRNKADLDTMSMDDLYNNLKVYKPEVKGISSSSSSTQNMGFVSYSNNNTSSTNEAVNTAHGVSIAITQVNAAYSTNIDNLSDAVIYAFFASQPNTLVSCDGLGGYDWSDQAEEGHNYALMAFSSSRLIAIIIINQFLKIKDGKTCWNNAQQGESQNFAKKTHPYDKKNLVPRAVLMKSGLVSVNTARQGNPQIDLQDKIDPGYVALEGTPQGWEKSQENVSLKLDETSGILKSFITGIENLVDHKVKVIRVAERRNMTLIEAARTMLADSKLPTTFCESEAVIKLLAMWKIEVLKYMNFSTVRTQYQLLSFMRPFGCPVTILNTIDHLGKFDGKADEGTQSNGFAGTKASDNACQAKKKTKPIKDYILLPLWTADPSYSQDLKSSHDDGSKLQVMMEKRLMKIQEKKSECRWIKRRR
ncbi:hypothetical protein Tco_1351634 [Tanacetum coccineum]